MLATRRCVRIGASRPADVAARLRRGYFASVSYTDDNIGKVLAAAAPILDRTVVVLIGDHGEDGGASSHYSSCPCFWLWLEVFFTSQEVHLFSY